MRLYAAIVPDTMNMCVMETPSYKANDIAGAPFIASTAASIMGYKDISSIVNWHLYGPSVAGIDYKFIRDCIMTQVQAIAGVDGANYANLSAEEQDIAARYVALPKTIVQTIAGDSYSEYIRQWDLDSYAARDYRIDTLVRNYLFENVAQNEVMACMHTIKSNSLDEVYRCGIEGTAQDGLVGILDYVESVAATPYANAGMAEALTEAGVLTDGLTVADVVNTVHDLLHYGYVTT